MKKFLEEKHDLLAGIFAFMAIIAIICEITFGEFSKESIIGGIKDASGLLIDILVLFLAASHFIRKPLNFKEKFQEAMTELKDKYEPLLEEDKKEGVIRYNIASNMDALFTLSGKGYKRIFELSENKPDQICFYVNKSFFDNIGGNTFDAEAITKDIHTRIAMTYQDFKCSYTPIGDNYQICVKLDRVIRTNDDIDILISLIDYVLFVFVARNKS